MGMSQIIQKLVSQTFTLIHNELGHANVHTKEAPGINPATSITSIGIYLTEFTHLPYFGQQYFCNPYSAHGHGMLERYKAIPYNIRK